MFLRDFELLQIGSQELQAFNNLLLGSFGLHDDAGEFFLLVLELFG